MPVGLLSVSFAPLTPSLFLDLHLRSLLKRLSRTRSLDPSLLARYRRLFPALQILLISSSIFSRSLSLAAVGALM